MKSNFIGPLLIACAALLWATDALFRVPAVSALDPTLIVGIEHLIGLLFLSPLVLLGSGSRKSFVQMSLRGWIAAIFIGMGGSAIATVLFTGSFRYINPSVTILLQKLQPLLVVAIAYIFLGEKPRPRFLIWAAIALFSGVVLSFPDLDFSFMGGGLTLRSRGVLYSIGAASLWAVTTVLGKALLRKVPVLVTTFWRYAFGLVTLALLISFSGTPLPKEALQNTQIWTSLFYMGLVPGLLAMLLYYRGLSRTPASVATFVELVFPVSAVVLNSIILKMPLSNVQLIAGAVLLFSVTRISVKSPVDDT